MADDDKRTDPMNTPAMRVLMRMPSPSEAPAPGGADRPALDRPLSSKPRAGKPPTEEPSKQAVHDRAKMFEAVLKAKPADLPTVEPPAEEAEKPKTPRDLLYRGSVFTFRPLGPPPGQERRNGVIERWQADSSVDGCAFSVVIREYYDGRFTPWSLESIFFGDFLQAATTGVIAGLLEARWVKEQWLHQQTRQKFLLFVIPAVALVAAIVGFIIGLRHA